jgi:hypothetical protein
MTQQTQSDLTVAGCSDEQRLWTEYIVTVAREQSCSQLYWEAWRDYVLTGFRDQVRGEVVDRCAALLSMWQERERVAYAAWKTVAYPQDGHGSSD